jgi:hypothetical protein
LYELVDGLGVAVRGAPTQIGHIGIGHAVDPVLCSAGAGIRRPQPRRGLLQMAPDPDMAARLSKVTIGTRCAGLRLHAQPGQGAAVVVMCGR